MNPAAVLILFGMVVCFATSFIAVKIAYQSFPPFLTVFLRYLLAAPFFLLLHRASRLPWPSRRDFWALAAVGLIEPGTYMMFDSLGMKFTTAAQASLMVATIPLFVVLLGSAVLKAPIHRPVLVGILFSMAGIAVLTVHDIRVLEWRHLMGNGFMLCAAAVAALWTMLVKRLSDKHPPLTIATVQALTTLAFFALLAFAESFVLRPGPVTPLTAGAVLYLGIVASGIGYLFLLSGIQRAGAVLSSVFVNLIPILVLVLAWLLLKETITPWIILSAALVLGSIFYLSKKQDLTY